MNHYNHLTWFVGTESLQENLLLFHSIYFMETQVQTSTGELLKNVSAKNRQKQNKTKTQPGDYFMIHQDFYSRVELLTPLKAKQKNYLHSGTFPGTCHSTAWLRFPPSPPTVFAGLCLYTHMHTITTLTATSERRQWESEETAATQPKDNLGSFAAHCGSSSSSLPLPAGAPALPDPQPPTAQASRHPLPLLRCNKWSAIIHVSPSDWPFKVAPR